MQCKNVSRTFSYVIESTHPTHPRHPSHPPTPPTHLQEAVAAYDAGSRDLYGLKCVTNFDIEMLTFLVPRECGKQRIRDTLANHNSPPLDDYLLADRLFFREQLPAPFRSGVAAFHQTAVALLYHQHSRRDFPDAYGHWL